MKKYSEEILNANVEIYNKVEVDTKTTTIAILYEWYIGGKLIVLPNWLQRKLREFDWFKNDYLNAKQYVASAWKNTNCFDSFSVLDMKRLILVISQKIEQEKNSDKITEYQKLFDYLDNYRAKGALYVSMDGQSRLILGIAQYMTGKFTLAKSGIFVDLRLNGKQSNLLERETFIDLPINIQKIFKDKKIPINIVTDFYELEDVTEALVNKQKGFEWSWFQKLKQSRRWSLFCIDLYNIIDNNKSFETSYEKYMSVSKDFKFDVDGHELYLVNMAYMYQYGHWPSAKEIDSLFIDDLKLYKSSYEAVIKYSTEYYGTLGKTKSGITPLINYVLFRQLMEGKTGNSKFTKQVTINNPYKLKDSSKFVDAFIKVHKKLVSIKQKHGASYIYDSANDVWIYNKEGYKASCGKQDDINIFRRMRLLTENINLDEFENKKYIVKIINTNIPSQDEIAIYNNWKDVDGNDIYISDLPEMDRSHYEPKGDFGTNEFDNLGLEHFSSNRSRGKKKLQKI